jgi:tyrosyl-tRNA synthetase
VTTPDPQTLPTIAPVPDVLADLEWRGLVSQSTDRAALADHLASAPVTLYCGFDPTADSLHLGSLVPLLALRRFQLAGHRPIALAGGATGFIGDPSGRTAERSLQTAEVIAARVKVLRVQMERFLDFSGANPAILADNLDWTADVGVLDFLRDVGKHFPVNQMLARESVAARLESGGLSFTEFSYQLLQSLDFLELHRRFGCTLQVGGNDQWGNITAGLDFMRRVDGSHGQAMTSPYALWQFLLNVDDRDASTYLRLLTFVGRDEVEALDALTAERPQQRAAQRRLADEVVALVHGPAELVRVQAASAALFGSGALAELDEPTLAAALAEAPSVQVTGDVPAYVDLLAQGLSLSKSDARRAVREGGAYLNNAKVIDEATVPAEGDWLHGRFLVLRRGKRSVTVVERAR